MEIISITKGMVLTNNENIIKIFINNNPNKFIDLSISAISKELFISIGSVTRFAYKIGFKSFKDLKNFVAKESVRTHMYQIRNNKDLGSVINDVLAYNIHSVERTVESLNQTALNEAIALMIGADQILTTGISSSALAAQELTNGLNTLGQNSLFANNNHEIILWIKQKQKAKTVVVVFSKSISGKETKYLVDLLNKHCIKTIIITANETIQRSQYQVVIKFKTLEQKNRAVAMGSKNSQLLIADIIIAYFARNIKYEKSQLLKDFDLSWRT